MNHFEKKIYDNCIEKMLIEPGDHVVAGVSGGADSVCLLKVLLAIAGETTLKITAVHVNHGLRGEAADADEAYVKELCSAFNVPLRCFHADIKSLAAEQHLSEEEAGRDYRYKVFEEVRKELGDGKIAVAHHRDDLNETVLMNLFRGTGIRGLAGIPERRGAVIRPLLVVSRREIEAYLAEEGLAYRTDATNLKADYTRNRIRLKLLPFVREEINTEADTHIAEMAGMAAEIIRYLDIQTEKAMAGAVSLTEKGAVICVDAFMAQDPVIRREIIRRCLGQTAGKMRDLSLVHVDAVMDLFEKRSGRKAVLPYNMTAVRTYDTVRIETAGGDEGEKEGYEVRPDMTGMTVLPEIGKTLVFSSFTADKNMQIPKKLYTKWFDYDKICREPVLRFRRTGDYMVLKGGLTKTLRRIMLDDRMPRQDRDHTLLLADGSHILWILGTDRISDSVKITETSTHILQAELRGINDERNS